MVPLYSIIRLPTCPNLSASSQRGMCVFIGPCLLLLSTVGGSDFLLESKYGKIIWVICLK